MAGGYNLGDLRAAIADINQEILSEKGSGEVLNSDVLGRLKKTRTHLVEAFTPQLVDMALTKLLNDVSSRKAARAASESQSILFANYPGVRGIFALKKGLKKQVEKFTPSELSEWNKSHVRKIVDHEDSDLNRLIADCKEAANSENETIGEILKRISSDLIVK